MAAFEVKDVEPVDVLVFLAPDFLAQLELPLRVRETLLPRPHANGTIEPNELVVNNFGAHGNQGRVGQVTLNPGAYTVKVGWYNGTSGQNMSAKYGAGAYGNYDSLPSLLAPGTFISSGEGVTSSTQPWRK